MAKTTVAKGPEITAENATEPVDHHNDEVSQSATLVLRNLGVYILARYKNFPPPLWKFFPVFAWTFPLFPLFMKSSMKFFPVFQISPIFPPPGGWQMASIYTPVEIRWVSL